MIVFDVIEKRTEITFFAVGHVTEIIVAKPKINIHSTVIFKEL